MQAVGQRFVRETTDSINPGLRLVRDHVTPSQNHISPSCFHVNDGCAGGVNVNVIMANLSQTTIVAKSCKHAQLFQTLERVFDAPSQNIPDRTQGAFSTQSIKDLRTQTENYIPLDIFRKQTCHSEPFCLVDGRGPPD
ncbi:hypothetical protein GJ744_001980 [Endocarpon pusillum]|uniref:Uncharacterized protein n=1 Tax=Endocarpon pusillum TaxID=364733 RepID=A0A8H7DZ61_9EURO|nr:hypothetical protein GJ744_001980 [Endocarpon pusillum]